MDLGEHASNDKAGGLMKLLLVHLTVRVAQHGAHSIMFLDKHIV